MTATPDDIAKFTTDGVLIERAYTTVKDLYPEALDVDVGNEMEMFFDDPADGFAMLLERAALLCMSDRLHDAVEFDESYGLGQGIALTPAVPIFTVQDDSRGINAIAAARAISFNMGSDRYALELCGTPGDFIPRHDTITVDMSTFRADTSSYTADGAEFTPLDLAPFAWWDVSDLSTMWQDSAGTTPCAINSPVGKIVDKSGNSFHLIQPTSGSRPILRYDAPSGLHWLEFDGTDDFLASIQALDFSAASAIAFAAAFAPSGAGAGCILELGPSQATTAKTFGSFFNSGSAGKLSAGVNSNALDAVESTAATYGSGVTSVLSCAGLDITQAAAASKLPLRRNGAALGVTTTSDAGAAGTIYSAQTLYCGARAGTSLFAAMKFYGAALRDTAVSAGEIAKLDKWLGFKAGL